MIEPCYADAQVTLYEGDALTVLGQLPPESVNCVVTSPPYWGLRDYGIQGQVGLEPTPEGFVAALVAIFTQVHRVLGADGTLWLNLGDSYIGGGRDQGMKWGPPTGKVIGLKSKDLVGIPWRVAFALQAAGWYLRSDIIWSKPNPMPESVTDRPTKAHEYLFLLSKAERYYYDAGAIREPHSIDSGWYKERAKGRGRSMGYDLSRNDCDRIGQNTEGRNKRSVWEVATQPYPEAHFATFPPDLIKPCILAGCPEGGVVLDPFAGSGTTALVAKELGRKVIGIDLNPTYLELARKRLRQETIWGIPA